MQRWQHRIILGWEHSLNSPVSLRSMLVPSELQMHRKPTSGVRMMLRLT